LDIEVISTFQIQSTGLIKISPKNLKHLKVNEGIYNWCKPGYDSQFILSVVDDLQGFIKDNQVQLLMQKIGSQEQSLAIGQTIDLFNTELCNEES
jgi:hypothetical protein